jgi:hypothetical protein
VCDTTLPNDGSEHVHELPHELGLGHATLKKRWFDIAVGHQQRTDRLTLG